MSDSIYKECPKCSEELEFNFAGNNGYVAFCGKCQALLYYCSIFSKIDFFKPTKESFEAYFKEFHYKPKEVQIDKRGNS